MFFTQYMHIKTAVLIYWQINIITSNVLLPHINTWYNNIDVFFPLLLMCGKQMQWRTLVLKGFGVSDMYFSFLKKFQHFHLARFLKKWSYSVLVRYIINISYSNIFEKNYSQINIIIFFTFYFIKWLYRKILSSYCFKHW